MFDENWAGNIAADKTRMAEEMASKKLALCEMPSMIKAESAAFMVSIALSRFSP